MLLQKQRHFFFVLLAVFTKPMCVCILTENLTNIEQPRENKNHLSHNQHECHSFGESRKNS